MESINASVSGQADESDISERIYKDRVEQARKLIKQGESATAKRILKELEDELEGKEFSQNLRYELYTNIASAHLHLEEYEDACSYLDAALLCNRKDPRALANAAMSALLAGNNARAIELSKESLNVDENQPNTLGVLLQASKRVDVEVSPELLKKAEGHVESRRVLAILSFNENNFEKAEKLYRENISMPTPDVQDSVLLAQTLIASVEAELNEGTHLLALPKIAQERLAEAEQLLVNTKEKWEKDDNRRRFANTLGLLIQVQSLQHKNDQVWNHCQQILVEFPESYPALYHSGLVEFSRRNFKGAITCFEKALAVKDSLYSRDRRIPLATAYLLEREYEKVIGLLQNEVPMLSPRANIERIVLLAKAYSGLKAKDSIQQIMDLLEPFNKDDPYVLEGLAQVYIELGDSKSAYLNLEAAYQHANDIEKSYFAVLLAEFHYERGEFEKAIPLYETSFTPNKDVPVIDHYLISLLNSGDYEKANVLAKALRKDSPNNPVFLVVEARVAEYIGELNHAKDLYLQLSKIQPDNSEHLMRVALLDYRSGDNVVAFDLLKQNIDKYWNSPRDLMTVAQIGANANIDPTEFLEYAYRARRLGMNDPNIHLAYVGLFFSRDSLFEALLRIEKIDNNVSVCVKSDQEIKKWFTILSDEPIDKARGEINSTDSLAQILIGHQKGDVVPVRDNFYESLEFTIVEIQSKYVRALQETLTEFGSMFPENLALQMIKVEGDDPTKMVALSARQNQIIKLVSDFYRKENITVGQFAKLIGRSQIQTWTSLSFTSGIVKASFGTPEEQRIHAANLNSTANITVELTSLLTLVNLGQLQLLSNRFDNVYLAQSVLDAVIEEIGSEKNLEEDHFTIEHGQDQIVVREIKRDQVKRNIELLEGLKEFIQKECIVVPITSVLKLGKVKYESLVNTLSAPSFDSVLVAKQTGTLIYSDDVILRGIAKNDYDVQGVWTQPVIKDCRERGVVSKDIAHLLTANLVFANYHYVSVNTELLIYFLEKNNWSAVAEVNRLIQALSGPYTSVETAIEIATSCVKDVWAKRLMLHQKTGVLNLLLNNLTKNRITLPTIQLFVNTIQNIYINGFTPWYANEIIEYTRS